MPPKKFEPVAAHPQPAKESWDSYLKEILIGLGFGILALAIFAGVYIGINNSFFASLAASFVNFFALNTQQEMWYLMRAAGMTAYVLLWLTTAWGLAVSSKVFDSLIHRSFIFSFHEFISLLSLGFLALHILVILGDKYLPFTIFQIFIPFLAPYRSFWVGIGTIAFYILALVTLAFYLKKRIGQKAFRTIHVFSLLGYFAALAHAFFSGTDSTNSVVILMYAVTSLVIVFLFAYWLLTRSQNKVPARQGVNPKRVAGNRLPEAD